MKEKWQLTMEEFTQTCIIIGKIRSDLSEQEQRILEIEDAMKKLVDLLTKNGETK